MITGTGTSMPIESYYELKSKQMLCTVHVICICSKGYKNLHEGCVNRNELMTILNYLQNLKKNKWLFFKQSFNTSPICNEGF